MPYDFYAIEKFCRSEDLRCEWSSSEEIIVRFDRDIVIRIVNADKEEDLYFGLSDGSWHTHGDAIFMTGSVSYIKIGPTEILRGPKGGDLLIGSRYMRGVLKDRWLFHRLEKQDFKYFESGELITVRRADLTE